MHSPLARQIAALGLALCAVALSLAYPLRAYLHQQAAEQAAVAEQHELQQKVADLTAQEAALKDPDYIKAEARRRLQYVSPGDTVYVVKVPVAPTSPPAPADAAMPDATAPGGNAGGSAATAAGSTAASTPPASRRPWYADMWDTLDGSADGAAATAGTAPATTAPATTAAPTAAGPSTAPPG